MSNRLPRFREIRGEAVARAEEVIEALGRGTVAGLRKNDPEDLVNTAARFCRTV